MPDWLAIVLVNFIYFMLYSFVGWVCETIWCSVGSRKFVNRGFLNGPLCPVYGFGAMLTLWLLRPFTENLFTIFLAGMVLTSALEYFTGWLLEKLFHLKLWDYSTYFCNLNGRVCLRNSLLFGLMSVALVWFIHPFIADVVAYVPQTLLSIVALGLLVLVLVDLVATVRAMLQLGGKLEQLQRVFEELHEKNETYRAEFQQNLEAKLEQHRESLTGQHEELRAAMQAKIDQLNARLGELQGQLKFSHRRVLRAWPNMTSKRHPESLSKFKEALETRRKNRRAK